MEWLRCNKCYREMKKSKRTFSLTHCGHLYCNICLANVTAQCAVCGAQNFKTMPLSNPPKQEMQNFFTPVDEYIDLGIKIEAFQNNQLSVVARGFEEIEKKYENMKKMYWNGMKEMNLLMQAYKKLEVETAKLKTIRNSLLKTREVENVNTKSSESTFLRYAQGHQTQRNWVNFPTSSTSSEKEQISNAPRQYEDQRNTQKYDPRKQCSSEHIDSEGSAADSGLWSMPGSSSSRMGVFRVPSAQKVPKSAATLRKKNPNVKFNH